MKLPKRNRRRGIAIVAVMIAIAITLVITNEFGTSTNVDLIAAANYRDHMRAHFLARSAQNLGELIVRVQQRLDNDPSTKGRVQITDYTDLLMQPFCGGPQEVHDALGPLADSIKGLGAEIGTCGFDGPLGTDDDKINVNCANSSASEQNLFYMLEALFYSPAYDPVFDEDDAEGWHRDRAMQGEAILDYIDADIAHTSGSGTADRGTTEDYGYEGLKDHYYAKNNYIDTVSELKLVRGIDDRFWTLFGKAFTAYGGCQINLQTLSDPQLIAAILILSAKNPNDPVLLDPKRLFLLANYVAKARQLGETFTTIQDFVAFVKDPGASVASLASTGQGTLAGSAASAAMNAGLPGLNGGATIGLELNATTLAGIVKVGPRRTYRISSFGEITRQQKNKDGKPVFPPIRATVTGVWDTQVTPQHARKVPAPQGAWVYEKEE